MTKKDYELIARDIKKALDNSTTKEAKDAIVDLSLSLALSFRVDNGRFDDTKFYKACGL